MKVRLSQVDPSLPVPSYASPGAAGFDLVCRADTYVPSHGTALIPGNVIVAVPDGFVLVVALRSGTPTRRGLVMPHGIGIIDRDYCGPEDEVKIQVYNMTAFQVTVERGARIAQGILLPAPPIQWELGPPTGDISRSGFGSTG